MAAVADCARRPIEHAPRHRFVSLRSFVRYNLVYISGYCRHDYDDQRAVSVDWSIGWYVLMFCNVKIADRYSSSLPETRQGT